MTTPSPTPDTPTTPLPSGSLSGSLSGSRTTPRAPARRVVPRVPSSSKGNHSASPPPSGSPGTGNSREPLPSPTSLITTRTAPFWHNLRDLLIDGDWHHRDETYRLAHLHDLAERTIANLLPRASKRRWISRSRGHVRLRDRAAFEAALAEQDRRDHEDGAR